MDTYIDAVKLALGDVGAAIRPVASKLGMAVIEATGVDPASLEFHHQVLLGVLGGSIALFLVLALCRACCSNCRAISSTLFVANASYLLLGSSVFVLADLGTWRNPDSLFDLQPHVHSDHISGLETIHETVKHGALNATSGAMQAAGLELEAEYAVYIPIAIAALLVAAWLVVVRSCCCRRAAGGHYANKKKRKRAEQNSKKKKRKQAGPCCMGLPAACAAAVWPLFRLVLLGLGAFEALAVYEFLADPEAAVAANAVMPPALASEPAAAVWCSFLALLGLLRICYAAEATPAFSLWLPTFSAHAVETAVFWKWALGAAPVSPEAVAAVAAKLIDEAGSKPMELAVCAVPPLVAAGMLCRLLAGPPTPPAAPARRQYRNN